MTLDLPRWTGSLAACALLAGCLSLAPPDEPLALPVSPAFPAHAEPPEGRDAALTGWRDYFPDPAMRSLVAQALAYNRDLRVAALRVEEARALWGIQRSERLPSLDAQAGLDRSRVPADLSMTGRPLTASDYQVALGLSSWELDLWGRLRSQQDAALEAFLSTDAARRAVATALVAEVANSYLALREIDERIAIARRTLDSRAETLRIFTRRVEVGSTSRLGLAQVQTLMTQAQALAAQLEQARAQQVQALAVLAGMPVALPPAAQGLDENLVTGELRAGLPSDLLMNRMDIVAAEHQLKAAHASVGAARAAFFPRIGLTAAFGTASAELDGLFAPGSHAWRFAPMVSLPLFDGGRLRANLDLADVRGRIAMANYEKAVQGAFREVADALSARQWLARQVGIAQEALAVQHERARLAQLRYDHGASAFLEVLDAQRDLLAAEQQLVQTRRALLSSRVSLYAALGGGSLAP